MRRFKASPGSTPEIYRYFLSLSSEIIALSSAWLCKSGHAHSAVFVPLRSALAACRRLCSASSSCAGNQRPSIPYAGLIALIASWKPADLPNEKSPFNRTNSRHFTERISAILPNESPPFYRTNFRHFTEWIIAI